MDIITKTTPTGPRAATGIGLLLAASALTVCSFVLDAVDTPRSDRALAITVHVLCVAFPVALGVFRLTRRRGDRFAWLLIGAGLLSSVTSFAQSNDATLYSIGRTGVWIVEVVIVYLLLAFPDGRLHSGVERWLFRAMLVVLFTMYLPSSLLGQYPVPSPWSSCGTDCPPNALLVGHGAESFVDDVLRPLREVLTFVIFAGVTWVIVRKARPGPPILRRVLTPVAVVAALRTVTLGTYDALRGAHATSTVLDAVGLVYVLSLALITLGFAGGLLARRLFVAEALQRLTGRLQPHASAADLRMALADALEDPSLEVVYWLRGDHARWVDETGWPVKAPAPDGDRAVTEVSSDGLRIAAILHEPALSQDQALVQGAASYALAALENDRLVGELRSSLDELSESRTRIVAVGDRERRKIERDLHDGAQQRLVALRVRLELLAERLDTEAPESAGALRDLEKSVDETIDEVRSFARGIYPALLAERGLSEALRAAGRSAPLPTIVDAPKIGRHPPEIETTVYFACMEALQNVAKHAHASGATIALTYNPHLRFVVSDDGDGFDPSQVDRHGGLMSLRDRLQAVGGELTVDSAPGHGTRITGVIPPHG